LKKNNWKLFFAILTILFALITLVNLADIIFFHTPIFSGIYWGHDEKGDSLFIQKIIKNTPVDHSILKENDILISIDDIIFKDVSELYSYEHRLKPGDISIYKFQRGDQEVVVNIIQESYGLLYFIISSIVGLLFLFVGYIVVLKKPHVYIPRLFYYFCFAFFLIIGLNYSTGSLQLGIIFKYLRIFGFVIWAPAILHFFLNFPLRAPILNKYPKLIYLFYLPSIIVIPYVILFNTKHLFLMTITIFIYIFFAFHILLKNKRKIINPHEKKSLRIITWGLILGLVPLGILALFEAMIIEQFGFTSVGIVFAFTAFVPIAFGYSIMRYGLMDVSIIVKKSLLYTAFTTSFILLYFLLVIGLGGFIVRQFGISSELANLIFLAIVALAFQPIRNWIQTVIDRRFYRDRYQYQKMLLQLSKELPGIVNIQDILKRVSETISQAMHVSNVMVHLYDDRSDCYKNKYSTGRNQDSDFSWQDEVNGLVDIIKKEKKCCLFYKIEEDDRYHNLPLSDKLKIEKLGIVLSVPMFYQDSLIGMISLGQKQSGQVYNQEDMDLLQTVANNAAIALINAHLHIEDIRKQRFENELVLARHIQIRLLPERDPEFSDLEIVGFSKPATIVGGDYYDYLPISKDRLFIFVGDVSGKGMSAALYMSKVQGMIQVATGIYKSPQKLLSDINRHLYCRMERNFFVTMLGALVDVKQQKISFCRAGHMPVYVKRKNKLEIFEPDGIGLGLEAGEIFDRKLREKKIKLEKDDYCLFFSDGLVEAMNPKKNLFGEKRLKEILTNGNFNTVHELKDQILKKLDEFQENEQQNDDITFIILKATK